MSVISFAALAACGGGGGGGPVNPTLGATAFSTNENVPLNGTLTATTGASAAVTFTQGAAPKSGALSGFTPAGAFVYTPNRGFTGMDSFTVTAVDSGGHSTTSTISITVTVDQAPTAGNTVVRNDSPSSTSNAINVLAKATDPDKDALTVSITTPASVGAANVNGDGTVRISGLPAGFKGMSRFGYTVTDPSGKTASAAAAIFIGNDPFRGTFVADSDPNGSGEYEVYLTDFAVAPVKLSAATQGSARLQGYAASDNGATVVYRSMDPTNPATSKLMLVQTAAPATQVPILLPGGALPLADANGNDQFAVSPDGKWIAVIAGTPSGNSLYVVSAANTAAVTPVVATIPGSAAAYFSQPTFTLDSSTLYFLAGGSGGQHRSLYLASVSNPGAAVLVSRQSDPATSDDISAFTVATDQSTIHEQANRNGRVGIWYVDARALGGEAEIDTPTAGVAVTSSTVGLPPGLGGSNNGKVVAYDVGLPGIAPTSIGIFVAAVSNSPNPQLVTPLETVLGFSPDNSKLLYTDSTQVGEVNAAAGSSGTPVGLGNQAWYDSSGNIVLTRGPSGSGSSLQYNTRPFGSPAPVTPAGTVAYAVDVSGFGRGIVVLGEAPAAGAAPATASLQIVNVLAANAPGAQPLYLATLSSTPSLPSPTHLSSYVSKVVAQ
ncbi:MAG TPA: Ig-like domain-containing protein [Steroidobacteraceae bacterium]